MRVRKHIFAGALAFLLLGVLSACGEAGDVQVEERTFGIDYSEEPAIRLPVQVVCGEEKAWVITTVIDDFIYEFSYDEQSSRTEQITWQTSDGSYGMVNIEERDGAFYAELWNKNTNALEIREYYGYGDWREVALVEPEGDGWHIMGSGLYVDAEKNIYLVNGNTVARFDGEGKQVCEYELKGEFCFFLENSEGIVECGTADGKGITLYELGEKKAEKSWTLEMSGSRAYLIRSSEEGTLCLSTNAELLFIDRESGSLLARTDLMRLGVSSAEAGYYDAAAGTLRLYGITGNSGEGLRCIMLSGRDTSEEQRTELVYGLVAGTNASADSSIWTAISTFNQKNEDYYVTIRDYGGWFNMERLHADMAAGNGPDIIDMAYSDYYEAYVKNGYLVDLSPYLEQSQYKDDIIWNVLDTCKVDGGLYMLAPQFMVSGLLVHPEYAEFVEEWNMETFLDLIEKNQWEKDIFGSCGDWEGLLRDLFGGRQQEFIDWESGEASFETEAFTEILELCREYAERDWPSLVGGLEDTAPYILCERSVQGDFWPYLFYTGFYGREYRIYGYPTSTGQLYEIRVSPDCCAIYAGSENKEGAWEFVESLLWDENQRCHGMVNGGFAIRSSILKEMEETSKEYNIKVDGEMLKISDSEIGILKDIIYNGNLTANFVNPDIWEVIWEEASAYIAGDKSAEETERIIQSRVGIILTE